MTKKYEKLENSKLSKPIEELTKEELFEEWMKVRIQLEAIEQERGLTNNEMAYLLLAYWWTDKEMF